MIGFYLKGLIGAILAGAIAGLVTDIVSGKIEVPWVIAVVLVVFVVVLVVGFVRRMQTTYTITNRRMTIDVGLLSRKLHQTRLERVQNVNTRQSVLERMLRIGTVDFDTAAESGFDFAFRGVAQPHRIVRTVDQALHELQQADPGV
jgi:uncharacterized membrane protein YdbT with pleckstrin-like domain